MTARRKRKAILEDSHVSLLSTQLQQALALAFKAPRVREGGALAVKMLHLARLIVSTNAQVAFVSETRNSRFTRFDLLNQFNAKAVHIVPAQGQSGGLWLLSKHGVQLDVLESSHHFFALCLYK
jgi:hypothetical protein